MSISPRTTTARLATAGVVLLAVLLTGCGWDSEDAAGPAAGGSLAADQVAPGEALPTPPAAGSEAARSEAGGGSSGGTVEDRAATSARVLPGDRDIVYRGRITVRVTDVARAAARAEDFALGADGVVFAAETSVDPGRQALGQATLTLRVPPTQFKPTLDALGALGKELSRTRSAQDVTTELADTGSRVESQERSVARVRALLAEADTIGEVVQVESELSRREADLESLQAQLARLRDVTDLATIDVTLVAKDTAAPPAPEEDGDLGFLAGLRSGWDAFVEIVLVALTVLGALLPFALAVGLVGLPAYALLRGRRRTPAAPTA